MMAIEFFQVKQTLSVLVGKLPNKRSNDIPANLRLLLSEIAVEVRKSYQS